MELNSISESPNLEEMLKTTAKKLQSNSDDVIDINLEPNWNGCSLFGILLGFPCVYYYDVESSDQNCLSYAQLIQIQIFQYDRVVASFTGKSLSEALLFAEHGENMLCTKIVLNVRNNFWTQHVLPRFELGIFMY